MVQGDEPMVDPSMIRNALRPVAEDPSVECVNLIRTITDQEHYDVNTIKVVRNLAGDAMYFSRAPIPTLRRQCA
jgi:3-deoxy-manno-octulosonate cytidylyltransferase (CMP-KDO synthetase)